MLLSARHILYSGHIQGVGFRMAVKNVARGFEVTGTVQNLKDGRVEVKVQAFDSDELQGFLDAISDSDLGSLIKEQEVSIIKPLTGVQGFHIIADSDA